MPGARQKIWFVVHADAAGRGSTRMRAHQLCAMVRPYLEDRYDLSMLEMPRRSLGGRQRSWIEARPAGGIYILTKVAVERMPRANALALQARADGVCFDYVDTPMRKVNTFGADIHLCASLTQLHDLRARQAVGKLGPGRPMPLLHNADSRLYDLEFRRLPGLSTIYWASEFNGHLPKAVRARITVEHIETTADADRTIGRLPGYNLHYAIRNRTRWQADVYKPFTRGIVAAICRSNIVVLKDTHDVSEFLGDDYPYLCTSRDTDEVIAVLDRAARDFGGSAWDAALERMRGVADRVSPRALAGQLEAVLKELGH
ncbi:MAG: hypothetical protein QNJ13_07640 [Paracoccaceae bacterium]|nr:hypothetical protein [Paracoccaceae bacterium]